MSSTVPAKNGCQNWAILFRYMYSHRWNWGTIAWKPMLIWPNKQTSFEDGHRPGRPVSVRNEYTVLLWRNVLKKIHIYLFMKYVKDVTFQLAQLKGLCAMILTWKNRGKMDTPSPNRPTSKRNRELNVERTCSKCLNQMDPNAFAASSQVMKPGCTFLASLTNGPIRCGWLLTRRDQLCFDQISIVRSDCFPFFFQQTGSSHGWHSTKEVNTHCSMLC